MIKGFDVDPDSLASTPGAKVSRGRRAKNIARVKKPPPALVMLHDLAPTR
ncbi:MAG: hypothetical protein QOC99_2014 [Acidobacteriota bacterium]|jgi:hypothetical protein|nr:hypothetical protein [Acidobacteriota bacterium]MDT7779502.1 hypothetical protein [Acidobacteriota bacterium]